MLVSRILIEPSDYYIGYNLGEVAMTRVAVARLSTLWPTASIHIMVHDPEALSLVCARATAVHMAQPAVETQPPWVRALWLGIPSSVRRSLSSWRKMTMLLGKATARRNRPPRKYRLEELNPILAADLMVVAGMGGVADVFKDWSFDFFERIKFALDAHIPVVMVGQGIGPIHDSALRAAAAEIFPRLAFISLREERTSRPLLKALGVSDARIVTTGDDAIELAFQSRTAEFGAGLGVNLRTADYANIDYAAVERFGQIFKAAAAKYSAPLVPLPIDRDDVDVATRLMAAAGQTSEPVSFSSDPIATFERIKSCRAIVTGSYHAAVFSLSMGVPVVGIANSGYYEDKFGGLADQFGTGCEVVFLAEENWPQLVAERLDRVWQSAETLKPRLLARAGRQIALGNAAYRKIHDLIESRADTPADEPLVPSANSPV